jgi:hypothetical protein
VLKATAKARARRLDAVLMNLGGGYRDFVKLAGSSDCGRRRLDHRPPCSAPDERPLPVLQAADVLVQASLAEGAAFRRSKRWRQARLSSPPTSAGWPCSSTASLS